MATTFTSKNILTKNLSLKDLDPRNLGIKDLEDLQKEILTARKELMKKATSTRKQIQDTAKEYKADVEKKIKLLQKDVKKVGYDQAQLVLSALKGQKWIGNSQVFQTLESKVPFKVDTETFEEFKKRQLLKDLALGILERAKHIRDSIIKDPIHSVKNIKEVVLGPKKSLRKKKGSATLAKSKKTTAKKSKKAIVH